MQKLIIIHPNKIRNSISLIESKLKAKVLVNGKNVLVEGAELDEFIVAEVIRAIDFGFDIEDALVLRNPDFSLRFINMKEHSRKKNLGPVRSRVIGTMGRGKGTIEDLTGAIIVVNTNCVGVIVDSEHLDTCVQAIISLIQGAKHANVFAYLEKQNVFHRRQDDDLGLKIKDKEFSEKL